MKQNEPERKLVVVTTRLPEATYLRFQELCEREYRSQSKELRRLIEERVAEDDLEKAA